MLQIRDVRAAAAAARCAGLGANVPTSPGLRRLAPGLHAFTCYAGSTNPVGGWPCCRRGVVLLTERRLGSAQHLRNAVGGIPAVFTHPDARPLVS